MPYPAQLPMHDDIVDYVCGLDARVCEDTLRQYLADNYPECGATLRTLPIDTLVPGHEDGHERSPAKEQRYAAMTTPIPPILVGDGNEILDGHHRYRVALSKGDTTIQAYVMDEG